MDKTRKGCETYSIRRILRTLGRSPFVQGVVIFLFLFAFFFILKQTLYKSYRAVGNDFTSYLDAAGLLLQGENPYIADLHFPALYPLFLPFALIPLNALPRTISIIYWYAGAFVSFIVSYRILIDLAAPEESPSHKEWPLHALIVFIILIPVLQNHFINGQVNLYALLLSVVFIYELFRKATLTAGLALAAAISLKIVPAIFLLLTLLMKKNKIFLSALIFTSLLWLAPIVLVGGNIFSMYESLLMDSLSPYLFKGWLHHPHELHFSLYGFLVILIPGWRGNVWVEWAAILLIASMLVFVHLRTKHHWEKLAYLFSLYCLAILLITPISEKHHLVWVLPALSLMFYRIRDDMKDRNRGALLGLVLFITTFYIGHFLEFEPFFFVSLVVLLCWNIWELLSGADQSYPTTESHDENALEN